MRDVAAVAGVSAKTVSRVMNDDRYVSADVRERVERAVVELGYVPNALARTFRSGRDAAIGVAVPDIADPFFAAVVKAIEREARARGTATVVTGLGEDPDAERAAVEALLTRQISGLVVAPVSRDQSYLAPWQARTALLFVDRRPGRLTAESVVEDDFGGAVTATAHLVAHGHRSVAFVGDTLSLTTTARRRDGYLAALEDAGLEARARVVMADEVGGPDGLLPALDVVEPAARRRRGGVTAIFSSNARTSLDLMARLHAQGSEGLGFVSYGDFPMADALRPAVTVVDQDPGALGTVAARRLFERVDVPGRAVRRPRVLPVRLVARGSCLGPVERAAARGGYPSCGLVGST